MKYRCETKLGILATSERVSARPSGPLAPPNATLFVSDNRDTTSSNCKAHLFLASGLLAEREQGPTAERIRVLGAFRWRQFRRLCGSRRHGHCDVVRASASAYSGSESDVELLRRAGVSVGKASFPRDNRLGEYISCFRRRRLAHILNSYTGAQRHSIYCEISFLIRSYISQLRLFGCSCARNAQPTKL